MEDARQGPVVRWLTILWIVALGIGYTSQYTGDLTGHRGPANWPAIFVEMAVATGIAVGLAGLLGAWAFNLSQYLLMVLFTYCVAHIAFRCLKAPTEKVKKR